MTDEKALDFEAGETTALTDQEKLDIFLGNWDVIEPLLVQTERIYGLATKLDTYITDVKNELATTRTIRVCVAWFAVIIVIILLGSLLYFLFCDTDFLRSNTSYTGTAFVVATISAMVVLLATLLRGAFRTVKERHKDEELPPHIVQVIKALTDQLGGNS